ncbi:nickel import ATP-binding protein NikD [Bacillus zhangzhouensis]|uniref:nickel import ATP-binding protein NikD n=1 Tax=Bacillus zhangzhouensis TaxID=1178540 RepID=UPI0020BF1C4E|nr:nickel import ATP-binding protein NikD [Bacillus zhangzhouensis]
MSNLEESILQIDNLHVQTKTSQGTIPLIQDVAFEVGRGQIVGLIGESGCGKTVTSMSILNMLDRKTTEVTGSITLQGRELIGVSEKNMRSIRGKDISYIMQNPMNSFTPVWTIGHQLIETIRRHTAVSKRQARAQAVDALKQMNLPQPDQLLNKYPFELSGGMLQRVMIAMAACMHPPLIIADEPTTALDVHTQKLVLEHLNQIRHEYGTAILLITHDLGVIAEMADQVVVMRQGEMVEKAEVLELFENPKHDYTKKLLAARPSIPAVCPI